MLKDHPEGLTLTHQTHHCSFIHPQKTSKSQCSHTLCLPLLLSSLAALLPSRTKSQYVNRLDKFDGCLRSSKFTNNCGYGTPLFLWQGGGPSGATTVSGELNGGIAWLGDWSDCENSGVNCAAAEFTLQNTGYSQADITLEVGTNGEWGNHL